jgi:basic amino acid/polyamine antiporter, APA family
MDPTPPPASPPTRLARRLGFGDAVFVGLGAMIGAGVFAAIGPAAGAAGNGALLALVIAALVAYLNAESAAQLAARHPESGGTYVYGRERLGEVWGWIAGWGFVIGKLASCTAMALTFGHYAAPAPALARPFAVAAVLVLTAVNYLGVEKTARLTRAVVVVVLAALAVVVAAVLLGGHADPQRLWPLSPEVRASGVLQAAGLLFFAFAGYARLATLGEEVIDPARTIPRAVPVALGITLVVYALVTASALSALDPPALAGAPAPLAAAVAAGRWRALTPVVRVGAAVASAGVLLSLLVGVSRTVFAMAARRDLPSWLAAVHPRYRVPHRAELMVGAAVALLVALLDVRGSIGFSAFVMLLYYAIANAAAFTLGPDERRRPRALAVAGVAACLVMALSLPASSVVPGAALLVGGALIYALIRRRRSAGPPRPDEPPPR